MPGKESVVIITLNYNQNEYTLACINSLLKSTYDAFKVLLIDNGSSEENFKNLSKEAPADDRLSIIRLEKNIGYVGGVNHGLKLASEGGADYFLVMNNDTLIDPEAVTALVDSAQRHCDDAIVSGKVYNYDEKDTLQYIGNGKSTGGPFDFKAFVKNRREKDTGQYEEEMEMGMLDDIFWLIPKKVFDRVGYYSDYFFLYGEQTDYALRAIQEGFKLMYTPGAKLWHKGGITTVDGDKQSPKITYWTTFATLKLGALHLSAEEAKRFHRNWINKYTVKRILGLLKGDLGMPNIKAHFLAVRHFRYWNMVRYKDNGYNPFNKQ